MSTLKHFNFIFCFRLPLLLLLGESGTKEYGRIGSDDEVKGKIHASICTRMHTRMHVHMHTYMHAHKHTHLYEYACMHTCTHAYMHTYTHAHTEALTHAHIHTQMNTHSNMQGFFWGGGQGGIPPLEISCLPLKNWDGNILYNM